MTHKRRDKLILVLVLVLATIMVLAGCGAFNKPLDTPVLTFNKDLGIINWDAVNDAQGYKVDYNGKTIRTQQPSFKLPERGKFTVSVIALPAENDKKHKMSEPASMDVLYTTKIATPNIELSPYHDGGVKYVIKNFDDFAKHYVITVNGKDYEVKTDRGVIDAKLENGTYEVSVRGVGDGIITVDGDMISENIVIKPVEKFVSTYETQDGHNHFKYNIGPRDSKIAIVYGDLYELDAKSYTLDYETGDLTIMENVLLSHQTLEPMVFEMVFENGDRLIIEVTIIDNREVNFGDTNYVTVFVGNPASISFDIYANTLKSIELVKIDGARHLLVEGEDKDYTFTRNFLRANVVIHAPANNDKSLIFTFEKDGVITTIVELTYYFEETNSHLSTSHLTYNKAPDKGYDMIVRYNPNSVVTGFSLRTAELGTDYTINDTLGEITLKKNFLDRLDAGMMLVGRVYFGSIYDTFTIHVIEDDDVYIASFGQSEYVYTTDQNDDLALTSELIFNTYGVSFDGEMLNSKYYSSDRNKITLSSNFLKDIGYGKHEVRVHVTSSTNYDIVANVIIEPHDITPSEVGVSIDNSYPYVKISYKNLGEDVTTYVTNKSTGKKYTNKNGLSYVLVPFNEMHDNDIYTVTHMRNGKSMTTNAITYKAINIEGVEKYYNAKFTYGGAQYDGVISSEKEFETFVHYAMMRVSKMRAYDSKNTSTDPNDTMLWSQYTGASKNKYEYTVKIYTPFLKYNSDRAKDYINALGKRLDDAARSYKEPAKFDYYIEKDMTNDLPTVEISFKLWSTNEPYALDNKEHPVTPRRYKLGYEEARKTKNPRSSTFDDFAINKWTKTQSVFLADELYYAIEDGARPIPIEGSPAEAMYNIIKDVMREICDDSMSEHEKYVAIYEWIISNVTYDQATADYEKTLTTGGRPGSNYYKIYPRRCFYLDGVFIDGVAVCNGLAKAIVVMTGIEGIESYKVMGSSPGGRHAWIKVKLDGIWYNSDPTWGSNVKDWRDEVTQDGMVPEGMNHNHTLVADRLFETGGAHKEEDRYSRVISNIDYDYFASTIVDTVDATGEFSTLKIDSKNDITSLVLSLSDRIMLGEEVGISFIDNATTFSVAEEIRVQLAVTTGYTWTVTRNKVIKSSYGKEYRFYLFTRGAKIEETIE